MQPAGQSVWPDLIRDETELEDYLSIPSAAVLEQLARLEGDLLVLGVGGKMGPTLARMAARALALLNSPHRVIGVARFSNPALRAKLEGWGVQTIAADLLDRAALAALPDARHIIFMAGQKFGASSRAAQTWAMNVVLPAQVAERYAGADIVVFSTANVYPFTPIGQGGATEHQPPNPVGEYAMSCLGRERVFEQAAAAYGVRAAIVRLSYAIDLRYGVLLDVAGKVKQGQPVDLRMGAASVIWQGDANAQALALIGHCSAPPLILNVSGPETLSIRWLAEEFGRRFGVAPILVGEEAPTALLVNTTAASTLFGYPAVSLGRLVRWTAAWVEAGGLTWSKPTHFDVRDGKF